MEKEKPKLRIIHGRGTISEKGLEIKPGIGARLIARIQDDYRRTLASNYTQRLLDESGEDLDPLAVLKQVDKLAEQAAIDEREWPEESLEKAKMLGSGFQDLRLKAALWFANIIRDKEIFPNRKQALSALRALFENDSAEARIALRLVKVSAEEVWEMKFDDPATFEKKLAQIIGRNRPGEAAD